MRFDAAPLRAAAHFRDPPPQAHEQEPPVVEKLRRLAFEGVSDELKTPTQHEKAGRDRPETVDEHGAKKERQREDDERDAERMAHAIDRMLMAASYCAIHRSHDLPPSMDHS